MTANVYQKDFGKVPRKGSVRLTVTLKDNQATPQPVPGASLATAKLTVYSRDKAQIQTGYDHIDVKASIDAGGVFLKYLPMAAVELLTIPSQAGEQFEALLEWTYTGLSGVVDGDGGWFRWLFTVVDEPQRS